ncbi:cd7 antigen-like isoform X2 [Brachyhypopomus gauderio]|uniref:cd7 antigen-like isoform X2 n=1 Tax=Brachyhypopomus gauderio TaxID=698409 RepID=UPI00404265AC
MEQLMVEAYGNITYLRRHTNDSVEFPCACKDTRTKMFAFAIKRIWLDPLQVLYVHVEVERGTPHDAYQGRVFEKRDVGKRSISVNITHLRPNDTDIYQCVFFHDDSLAGYDGVPGVTEFFLHVDSAEPCSCYDYKPFLYSLSTVAGLLCLCVLGLSRAFCPQKQPTHQPVYEEMRGMVQNH